MQPLVKRNNQPYEKERQQHAKRRAQIIARYNRGISTRQIALEEGISTQRVYQIINGEKR
jgi:transposase